jgi:hypothetical protein
MFSPRERIFCGFATHNLANAIGKTPSTISAELTRVHRLHGGWISPDSTVTAMATTVIRGGDLDDFSVGVESDLLALTKQWLPRWAVRSHWKLLPRIGFGKQGFSAGITFALLD